MFIYVGYPCFQQERSTARLAAPTSPHGSKPRPPKGAEGEKLFVLCRFTSTEQNMRLSGYSAVTEV